MDKYLEAQDYCFKKSWKLRRDRKRASKAINRAVDLLGSGTAPKDLGKQLRERIKDDRKLGNPFMMMIFMNLILPIIIKLILKWWEKRNG